jgi:hypothetical protein
VDIVAAIGMAPGITQIVVYNSNGSDVDMFNQMATDNSAKQLLIRPRSDTTPCPIHSAFLRNEWEISMHSLRAGSISGSPGQARFGVRMKAPFAFIMGKVLAFGVPTFSHPGRSLVKRPLQYSQAHPIH